RPDAPPLASATTLHSTDASIEPPRAGAVADPDPIAAPSSVVTVPEEAIWRRCALPDLPDDLTTQAILEIHGEQSVIGSQVTIEAGALLMPDHADSWLATIHHHRVSADVGDARYTFTLDVRLDRPCAVEDVAIVPYHTEEIRCPITVASPIASLSEDDATVFQTTEQPPLDDASGPALLTRGRVDGDTLIIHGPPSGQGMLEVEIHAGAAGASSLAQSVSWRDGQCAPIVIREPVHVEGTVNLDDTDPSRPPMCVLETCSPRRAGHNGHFAVDISPDDLPCAIYAICHFDTYRRESAPVLIDAAPGETITVDFDPEETRLIIVDIQTYHTPNGYGINSVRFRSDAERVGLMKGDVIVAIDGILTHTLSHDDFQTLYAGPIGEDVELLVTREGVEERLRFRRGGAEARR
ncbi:MAG: PDZ domain-containing protein, partial [Myxococcota bacterium]